MNNDEIKEDYGLNARQLAFAENYACWGNATKAAKAAGYSQETAYAQGHRLLKVAEIQAAIADIKLKNRLAEPKKDDLIEILKRALFFDPACFYDDDGSVKALSEIDPYDRQIIEGIEQKPSKQGIVTIYKIMSRTTAAEKLSALLGWSKNEIDIRFMNLSEEELDREIEEASKKLKGGADGN